MRSSFLSLAFLLTLAGCLGAPVVGGRLSDAANDLAPPDVPADGPDDVPPDAAPDAAPDASPDVAPDLPPLDAPPDVAPDVALDAPPDVFRCASAADCAGMAGTPACDTASGRCVACTAADDRCPADRHCDGATFTCVAGCRADEGCPTGRRCDAAAHACVECVTDAHCPAGRVCAGNACVPGCNAMQPCAAGNACCAMACVDTQTSAAHCGACGARCDLANATARCAAGRCAVDACAANFGDCDADPADGCEVDTRTALAHCGACGRACAPGPNQTAACAAGTCTLACAAGFADCDGAAANGCEVDTRTTLAHCGACRAACAVANGTPACRAGRCEVASCAAGFADCDMSAANGCEADTRVSTAHCGVCGRACGAGETCVAGACTVPLEVTGCARGGGGTAAGANVFREFCRVRGRVGVISGALATATSATLRVPFAGLPAGARVVRAFLYRQTYDSTGTYLSAWTLLGSNITPTTDFIGTSTGSPLQIARAEITDLVRAAAQGSDGVRAMALTQSPNTSSGGFGWWMVYEAPSLPERTVIVYDGMHTDRLTGNGAFTFTGFNASANPPSATFHVFGGGDDAGDAPSVARINPGTAVTVDDVTHPGAGNYAGVQVEPLDDRVTVGATSAPVDFTLRNYSAVSFAVLEVGTGTTAAACSPACPAGQTCESGRCFPADGCRASMRRGFTDGARFPDIAACGARATWEAATAVSSNVCASGWHPCTADDVTRATGAAPDFLTQGSFGWVVWVDGANTSYGNYPMARCGGTTPAVANLRGTGACTPSGAFPEGWRLAVDADTWGWSHARTGPCVDHAIHRCAYPGGTVAQQRGHTLCCRNTP